MQTIKIQLIELVKADFNKRKLLDITLDSTFKKDLGLDSLSLTELIIACEDLFGIEIDIEQHPFTTKDSSLHRLYDIIMQLTGQSESAE